MNKDMQLNGAISVSIADLEYLEKDKLGFIDANAKTITNAKVAETLELDDALATNTFTKCVNAQMRKCANV
jgi:hypothetical protein